MSYGAFVSLEKKVLENVGPECDPFEGFNADVFDPSKYCRPRTRAHAGADVTRKPRPVLAWKPVMLDVVAVIEERHVVEEPVVTRDSSGMLEVTVQKA
jgi:hypothetical protein